MVKVGGMCVHRRVYMAFKTVVEVGRRGRRGEMVSRPVEYESV